MRGAQRRRALPELARLHDKRELGIDTLKVLLLLAHNMRIVWSQQNKALLTGTAPLATAAGAAAAASSPFFPFPDMSFTRRYNDVSLQARAV